MLRGQLEQVVGAAAAAKSNVVSFTAALRDHGRAHEEAAAGIKGVNEALEGMTAPLTAAVGGFGKMAEILGVAFAAEKIIDFAKEMGELGERTLNLSAAVGTTPEKFSLLSTALGLAGGNTENASRTLERLGHNISIAISTPTSQAALAFKALGITEQQPQKASTDLEYGLRLLAEKFVEFQDTPSKTAAYFAILGRGMENLIPIFRQGGEGLAEFTRKARETGALLDGGTAQALADTGEKIHLLEATLEGAGVKGFLAFKGAIDSAISGLTSFVAWVGSAITAVKNFNALPPPSDEGFYTRTGKWRTFHPTPEPPEGYGPRATEGHYEQTGKWRKWVPGENPAQHALAQELELERNRGAAFATGEIPSPRPPPEKPVVPPLEKPEKAKGGRGHAAKDTSKADAKEAEQLALARIGNEEKVDDAIFDRRQKLIEATEKAGKISLASEYALLVENLEQKQKADQAYAQQKIAAAQGDAKEQQRILDQAKVSYQEYLTKRQDLDIKYFEARKAAEQKAAQDSKTAWDAVLQPLTSGFDSAIKGFIQGTTTLQQALQRAFESVLLDPLLKNVTNGLKSALMGAFSGTDVPNSFIGKFFSGTLFGGATATTGITGLGTASTTATTGVTGLGTSSTTAAAQVTAFGQAAAAATAQLGASGGAGGLGGAGQLAGAASGGGGFFSWLGGLFGGGATAGIGGAATLSSGGAADEALAATLLAFRHGGIVASAAAGWQVPSLGSRGVLARLHSQEMVLPANISQMLQAMARGGGTAGSVNYAPTINARGAAITPAQFAALLSQSHGELTGLANNAVRNGWRPGRPR